MAYQGYMSIKIIYVMLVLFTNEICVSSDHLETLGSVDTINQCRWLSSFSEKIV